MKRSRLREALASLSAEERDDVLDVLEQMLTARPITPRPIVTARLLGVRCCEIQEN